MSKYTVTPPEGFIVTLGRWRVQIWLLSDSYGCAYFPRRGSVKVQRGGRMSE